MKLDPAELSAAETYKILIGSVVPRAIGWTSTLSLSGVPNLAPFSFFTVVSRQPPMVSLTIQPRSDLVTPKDTLVNIRETGEFVVNIVSFGQVNEMHLTSVEHPPGVDEFKVSGLEQAPSDIVRPPRVAGAPVSMECKLDRILSLGDVGDNLVIGRVVRFHIRDDVWRTNGRVDTASLQPVGRLAAEYALQDTVFACPLTLDVLSSIAGGKMKRIDGKDSKWAAVDDKSWSPAGNVKLE